ncbi:MAG: hypothetical protein Q7W02_28950 [Candidatus Rokubacteria bacterium]|nr:hypothetical protein [Candidatus Rokubacteria bacterium]
MFSELNAELKQYSRFCYQGRPVWRVLARILYVHPAALAVIWYRVGSAARRIRVPFVRQLSQLVYLIGMPFVRIYSGVQIKPQTKIDPGLTILHFGGILITRDCTIGANCLLYHNVSIVTMRSQRGATIGNHFYAGTDATILGTLSIEDNVTVGAGAVVTKSVPKDAVVAGVPARILRFWEPSEDASENQTLPNRSPEWLTYQTDTARAERQPTTRRKA